MSKRYKNIKKETTTQPQSTPIVVNEIKQVSVDRTPKDIQTWRNAHRSAESIYYPNRSRLLDLYADVWLDGHLTGIWGKRSDDATNREIRFVDATGKEVDLKRSGDTTALLDTEEWDNLLGLIMDSKLWGLSGVEFIPGQSFHYEEIPRKHILIENQMIKINQSDQDGIPYQDNPFVWVIGKKNDLGLMLKVSFYALIKKGNFGDWAQYSEIFGQPIRVVKYDAFDDKTRIQLKQVLDESGSSLALMIPKQADFEIMDGKTSNGDGQLQERLKNACNNEMDVCLLGNTETTGNDNGGSNAKAKEQGKEQAKINKKDIKFLLSQLNDDKFLKILESYGFTVTGGRFVIQPEQDPYKAQAVVTMIAQVKEFGTPVSDDYVYEVTGIPKPDNYDQLKAKAEQKSENERPNTNNAQKPENKKKDEPTEDLTDSMWNKFRSKLAAFFDPAP